MTASDNLAVVAIINGLKYPLKQGRDYTVTSTDRIVIVKETFPTGTTIATHTFPANITEKIQPPLDLQKPPKQPNYRNTLPLKSRRW